MVRPRRSLLFMPGSNARALEKARILAADPVFKVLVHRKMRMGFS